MSLRKKLYVLFSLFYLSSLILIISIVSYTLYNQISNSIKYEYQESLKLVDSSITNFFKEIEADLKTLRSNTDIRNTNDQLFTSFLNVENSDAFKYNISKEEQKIIDIFNSYKTTHPYVNSVYMGRENGSFVRSQKRTKPTKYDPRLRPWYVLGKNSKGAVARLETYPSVTNTDINIGNVIPLTNENNEVYGVMGMDITLDNLANFINEVNLTYNVHIQIITDTGKILVSNDKNLLNQNIGNDFFTNINKFNENKYFLTEKDIVVFYKSPYLNWYITGNIPKKAILNEYLYIFITFIIISILLYTVICIIFYRFFSFIISKLEKNTKKLQSDLDTAKSIQNSLFPDKFKSICNINFYSEYIPVDTLSGDYYNYFMVDNKNIVFFISDVSGHGISAAMLTIFLNHSIQSAVDKFQDNLTPAKILNFIYEEYNTTKFNDELYILLFLCVYNIESSTITYSSSGLNTVPILVSENGNCIKLLNEGFPICKLIDIHKPDYKEYEVKVCSNDKLFLYTDGLSEFKNIKEETYSDERVFKIISESSINTGEEIYSKVSTDILTFQSNKQENKDDLAYFIAEFK